MKKEVIFLIFLVVCMPFSYAKVVDIPGVEGSDETLDHFPENLGIKKFIYAGSNIFASIEDSEIKYYHQDRLSNRLTTDSGGNRESEFKSLPFGQKIENSGVDNPFTGKEEDESSLYYFGARYYDDNLGRFVSVDPIAGELPYAYVLNNPMNRIDPSGMTSGDDNEGNFGRVQEGVLGDIEKYLPAINELSSEFGVDPRVIASIVYVERSQYQLDNFRKIKEKLLENELFEWFYKKTGRSTGWYHITCDASSHSSALARGDSISVTSTDNAMFPDSTRTLFIGDGLVGLASAQAANSFLDDSDSNRRRSRGKRTRWDRTDRSNINDLDVALRILSVIQVLYEQQGHDISGNPAILGTAYNIGIRNSFPDSTRTPGVGGSNYPYILDGQHIEGVSFGQRVQNVYDSSMMDRLFPLEE